MFITISSGSIIFYLFVYCLSCLNVEFVKLISVFSFWRNPLPLTSFCHLISSLARTNCETGLNEPKLHKACPWKIKFSSSSSRGLTWSLVV